MWMERLPSQQMQNENCVGQIWAERPRVFVGHWRPVLARD